MKLLLFIPCYNCGKQLKRVVDQLTPSILSEVSTVLFVDNMSTDGKTLENAMQAADENKSDTQFFVYQNSENYGLGGSHKVAFNYAIENEFDFVLVLHGDDQGKVIDFLPEIKELPSLSDDFILGSRFANLRLLSGYSRFRVFGNIIFNMVFSILLFKRISDLGSGLNLFRVDALKKLDYFLLSDDLTFNYALTAAMSFSNNRMRYVPIQWHEEDQASNVRIVKQVFQVCKILMLIFFLRKKMLKLDQRAVSRADYVSNEAVWSSNRD